jgi:microcystin-dependent protein
MSQPYVGEIRMVGCNFAPVGWAFCDGSTLAISQNDVLFALIGTTFGGDGVSTFNLPDLRGRIPVHQGPGFVLGQAGGTESITLTPAQLPSHNHLASCRSTTSDSPNPAGAIWGATSQNQYEPPASINAQMMPAAVASAGGNQPHENRPPFLVVNFIISLFGIFPTQS